MALQVWLSLNGNVNNQGLADITATNSGATVDSNGKIGQCYSFDGSDDYINIGDIGKYFDGTAFSICFWIYSLEDKTRAAVFSSYGLSSTSNFFALEINSSNATYCKNNLRFDWKGTDTYSPDDFITYDDWIHVCVTYDGVNKIKMYKNGELVQTTTRVLPEIPTGNTYYLGRDSRTGTTAFNGRLNDFRIYDHCLSPRECKQVSTALVLHYPLNRGGFGKDNLLHIYNHNIFHLSNNASAYPISRQWLFENGVEYEHITRTSIETNPNAFSIYCIGSKTVLDSSITAGMEVTVSVWVRCSHNLNNAYLTFSEVGKTSIKGAVTPIKANQWTKLSLTTTLQKSYSDYSDTGRVVDISVYGISIPSGEISNFYFDFRQDYKMELGTLSTPWTPNQSDELYSQMGLDNNIEYDVSGYGNNGTRVGTFSWSGDTPRYGTSTVFSGDQYIVEPNEIITTDSTIALWVKSSLNGNAHVLDARNNSGIGKQPIYQYTNGGIQTGGNASYVTSNSGLLVANTWVHVVLVQNGDSLLIYKNGDLFRTISCANSPVIKPTLGARYSFSSKYTGQLSDFRIYATALSADDVRDLYSVAASVSNNGTLMASEVSEL